MPANVPLAPEAGVVSVTDWLGFGLLFASLTVMLWLAKGVFTVAEIPLGTIIWVAGPAVWVSVAGLETMSGFGVVSVAVTEKVPAARDEVTWAV